jgi:hypothetical protein
VADLPIKLGKKDVGVWVYDCTSGASAPLLDFRFKGFIDLDVDVTADILKAALSAVSALADWFSSTDGKDAASQTTDTLNGWRKELNKKKGKSNLHVSFKAELEIDAKGSRQPCPNGKGVALLWYEYVLILRLLGSAGADSPFVNVEITGGGEVQITLARGIVSCHCPGVDSTPLPPAKKDEVPPAKKDEPSEAQKEKAASPTQDH